MVMTRVKSGRGVMSFCRNREGAVKALLPFLSQIETFSKTGCELRYSWKVREREQLSSLMLIL